MKDATPLSWIPLFSIVIGSPFAVPGDGFDHEFPDPGLVEENFKLLPNLPWNTMSPVNIFVCLTLPLSINVELPLGVGSYDPASADFGVIGSITLLLFVLTGSLNTSNSLVS